MLKLPTRDEVKYLITVHYKPNILRRTPSTSLQHGTGLTLVVFPYLGVPYQPLNNLIGLKIRLLV